MQYMARLLLVMGICWVWLLTGCTDSPRHLLDQAERAFVASLDSADFYLSQIEHPEKLAPKEQLRYAYLKGKIEFYTLGSQSDSLLREANRLAIQEKDSFYISQLLWLDIQRKSYYEKPDSVLLLSQALQENYPQMADSLAFYMHYYRQHAYMQKENWSLLCRNRKNLRLGFRFDPLYSGNGISYPYFAGIERRRESRQSVCDVGRLYAGYRTVRCD